MPKVGKRVVDKATGEIGVRAEYPDDSRNRKGFNPIDYPDVRFAYTVRVRPEGAAFRILVDLEQPLPGEWVGKVGFDMELFPGILFGKTYATETSSGIFPRQADGAGTLDAKGDYQIAPLATGKRLVIAPESDRQRMAIEDVTGGGRELVDGRGQHNNGWFVVRSLVAKGATKGAAEWLVAPHAIPGLASPPTVQVSQVGYHPKQSKWAIVELDARDARRGMITPTLRQYTHLGDFASQTDNVVFDPRSYIPGGSVSGTALIRPDYPELLEWPYLWQQTEYVLGGGTTDYMFLVLAADRLLNGG